MLTQVKMNHIVTTVGDAYRMRQVVSFDSFNVFIEFISLFARVIDEKGLKYTIEMHRNFLYLSDDQSLTKKPIAINASDWKISFCKQ